MSIHTVVDRFPLLLGWKKPYFDFPAYLGLIQKGIELVHQHNIDLIHSNSGAPNQWLVPVAKMRKLPLLTQLHAPYRLRDRLTLRLHQASITVGVSNATVIDLLNDGISKDIVRVIPNGIDINHLENLPTKTLRKPLGISQHSFLLASIGSLIQRKGFDILIRAVKKLRDQAIPAELLIIGGGEEEKNLKALCRQLELAPYVHFMGERKDAFQILKSGIDVFVSGAREEAFGLVLAEAGLAGLACVAPNNGGIPEVIEDQYSGILYPTENINSLTQELHDLYFHPNQRNTLGNNAKQRIKDKFNAIDNCTQFEMLYCHAIKNCSFHQHWLRPWNGLKAIISNASRIIHLLTRAFPSTNKGSHYG
jgi:glycosyltransferase involved in cell wall biosynthesis